MSRMMGRLLTIVVLAGSLMGVAAPSAAAQPAASPAATAAAAPPGKAVFDRWCAECHAPGHGHPGTQQLGWTRGEKLAVLEQRKDLVPDYVKLVVRRGLVEMPPYRPTEISDAELAQLAAYLAKKR
jgi:mono/diheme cytochrome c family protein